MIIKFKPWPTATHYRLGLFYSEGKKNKPHQKFAQRAEIEISVSFKKKFYEYQMEFR